MPLFAWLAMTALAATAAYLAVRLHLVHRAAHEIGEQFLRKLEEDTNTVVSISTGDRHMRALAADVNRCLRQVRALRLRYIRGDCELKSAVSGISHDLRTPLTVICGYLDMLSTQDMSDDARRYVGIIKERSHMLSRLTEELFGYSLAASADAPLSPSRVSLGAVLEDSLAEFYSALSGRGIVPEIDIPERPVVRLLDRDALSRIFSNLLSNAVKYSAGDLSVSLNEDGEISFRNRADGIDAVAVGRLFERFYTVRSSSRSTGLGLSVAKTLAERMGGSVSADLSGGILCVTVSFKDAPESPGAPTAGR